MYKGRYLHPVRAKGIITRGNPFPYNSPIIIDANHRLERQLISEVSWRMTASGLMSVTLVASPRIAAYLVTCLGKT